MERDIDRERERENGLFEMSDTTKFVFTFKINIKQHSKYR
jgi:hypothetical protein